MDTTLGKSAQKVQLALKDHGLEAAVVEFSHSTRTAKEAAEAIGCEVGQIAKSLVFRGKQSNRPVLVIASGINRVNEKKLQSYLGEKIEKADAAFVLEHTGFAIGGVPPVGHTEYIKPFIDEDLLGYREIWSAAGTPHAVFKLTPDELLKITRGDIVAVK